MSQKLIITLLFTTFLLSSCGQTVVPEIKTESPKKSVTTEIVKSDYFAERVKLVGKIAPLKETVISAQVSGVIKTLNATVGNNVKKGDILATLDLSTTSVNASFNNASTAYLNTLTNYGLTQESIEKDLENARIALENTRTNKENTYTSTEKQLQLAKIQLDNTLTQKNNLQKTTSLSVDLATKSRDQAKTALENFEKTSRDTLTNGLQDSSGLYSSTQVSMKNTLITIDSALTQADTILGITDINKTANDGYETYLGVKNIATKALAENAFHTAYNMYHTTIDTSAKETHLADIVTLTKAAVTLYDSLIGVLDNSITSSQFSQASLDSMRATVSAKQTSLTQAESALVTLSNSLTTTRTSLETGLSIAETNLQNTLAGTTSSLDGIAWAETLTRTQLENTIATIKSTRDAVDNALKTAEAQYASSHAKLQSQLTGAKSQLDASKGQKDIAAIQSENGVIRAPFDGVILSKNMELGSLVNPGTPLFILGDNTSLMVRTDVNPDIITSLRIGQEVIVTKDSKALTGTISLLAPGLDIQTRMFRVEIVFQDGDISKKIFRIGDFSDVFISRMKSDIKTLTIPFSALTSDGQGGFVVYVIGEGNIAKRKIVKIGTQNESHVEILEGIKEGDRVVISWALNLQDGDGISESL